MTRQEKLQHKILTPAALKSQLAVWRFQEKKIVFTNGCFDILHLGHIDYLSKAAGLGDVLIVGLNSDNSVSRLKGPHRPITDENSRSMVMVSLSFVDAVAIFDEDTPYELIKLVVPDILVKGGDYDPDTVVGADIVKNHGGKVVILPFIPGYSTTAIEEKIYRSAAKKD
ncbi:MAG: D-glycero-beta-D-manno-heptose 1-phosphate adenylyltransferase [Bacteroidales bacterium]